MIIATTDQLKEAEEYSNTFNIVSDKRIFITKIHKWLNDQNVCYPTGDISEEDSVFYRLEQFKNKLYVRS